jgi:hypothetical protein
MASSAVDCNKNSSAVFKMIFAAGTEMHGASMFFLLSHTTNYPGANNLTIAETLTSYYVSFAVTLDPNPMRLHNAPFWPSYASGGKEGSVLDITYTTIGPGADPDVGPRCDFFNSNGAVISN